MNRFLRFVQRMTALPFKEMRDQLEEEQCEQPEDGVYDISEWLGFLGASVWLVLSLGRIKWENDDWRARSTGALVVVVGAALLGGLILRHSMADSVT